MKLSIQRDGADMHHTVSISRSLACLLDFAYLARVHVPTTFAQASTLSYNERSIEAVPFGSNTRATQERVPDARERCEQQREEKQIAVLLVISSSLRRVRRSFKARPYSRRSRHFIFDGQVTRKQEIQALRPLPTRITLFVSHSPSPHAPAASLAAQ